MRNPMLILKRYAGFSKARREFYKSMTTYADHRVWQDVYHAATLIRKDAYIKITLRAATPVIQFKEK
jgi:motility quorum-sensing regulator/GCU-specific mRNA interferase toxin